MTSAGTEVGNSSFSKHSLYKLASPLQKTSYLQQGKLQVTEDDSRLHSLTMPIATHEDFNPAQHPTEDISRTNERFRSHTHSLSPSDSEDGLPVHPKIISEKRVPTHTIHDMHSVPVEARNQVLLVDADSSGGVAVSNSISLETTSVRVPSPVKVISHFKEDAGQRNRFSSDFNDQKAVSAKSQQDLDNTLHAEAVPSSVALPLPHDKGMKGDVIHKVCKSTICEDEASDVDVHESTMHDNKTSDKDSSRKHESTIHSEVSRRHENAKEGVIDSSRRHRSTMHSDKGGEKDSFRKQSTTNSSSRQPDQSTVSSVKKKKKGRTIASRYMSGTSDKKQSSSIVSVNTQSGTVSRTKTSKLPRSQSKVKPVVEGGFKIPTAPPRSKKIPVSASYLQEELSLTPVVPSKGITTSTPFQYGGGVQTHDGSYLAEFCGASAIKNSSFKRSARPPTINEKNPVNELEMELLYHRLIQSTYLDVTSAKALRHQETEAKNQLFELWKAVENKREENSVLTREIEAKERSLVLDNALDVQLNSLGPLCSKLPLLQQQHGNMARALDATRHNIPLEGVLSVDEEVIEAELADCESLLGEINAAVREKFQKVSDFSSSSDAIFKVLDNEYHELDRCREELSKLLHAHTKETSLQFEKKYRKPDTY